MICKVVSYSLSAFHPCFIYRTVVEWHVKRSGFACLDCRFTVILEDDFLHITSSPYLRLVSLYWFIFREIKSIRYGAFLKVIALLGKYASADSASGAGGIQGFNRIGGINHRSDRR